MGRDLIGLSRAPPGSLRYAGLLMFTARKATPDDAGALAGLLAVCAEGHPARGATPDADWVRGELLADPSICRVLLAEREGEPIGFASWRPAHDHLYGTRGAEVIWLFVLKPQRGIGVTAVLLTQLCAHVRDDGGVFLWGTAGSEEANAFYERLVVSRPVKELGLTLEQLQLLADLAGKPPKEIARVLAREASVRG